MPYQDVMNIILPHQGDHAAHITGHYGEHRAKGPHGGSDFNYQGGQTGINLTHPTVHSPVTGEVTFVGGQYGTIKVKDAQGNSHEILHTSAQSVIVGQHLDVGDAIGTMGGRGPHVATQYAQHVHYQMKDSHGHAVNPEQYWGQHPIQTRSSAAVPLAAEQQQHGSRLERGAHGPAVHELQTSLAALGCMGADGKPLQADGDFGVHTRHAVETFQRNHQLKADGIAGPRTLDALHAASLQVAPGMNDPKHPDHAMYAQALAGVHKLDANIGRTPDQYSNNLAASLVVAAKHEGLTRIDRVALSNDGSRTFAVQGKHDEPLQPSAHVQTAEAVNAPLAQSSTAAAQIPAHALPQTAHTHDPQPAGPAVSM